MDIKKEMEKLTENGVIERIWYFRTEAHIGSAELSRRLGKSDNYIAKLESHDFGLTVKMLCEIIEALGVSYERFFAPDYKHQDTNNELFHIILKMIPAEREALLNYIYTVHPEFKAE